MLGLARAALLAALPAELVLVVLLLSGVSLPVPVIVAGELAVASVLLLEAVVACRLFLAERRSGADRRAALRAAAHRLVPARVLRIMEFELKSVLALAHWAARRRHGVPPGATAVPYAGGQSTMLLLMLFAMAVETVGVEVLLRALEVPDGLRLTVLVLDVYGVVYGLALAAACVTRPHVVSAAELRVRYGVYLDLRIPRELISSVRVARNYNESGMVTVEDGRLGVAVSSQTNVAVELAEPVTVVRPLGRRAEVTSVSFFADTPAEVLTVLRSGLSRTS
ncbi:hypothetical protein [Planomonospora venezuelensis]|uniref:Uncharacterized protein n=1 Tax=Planomonospora venezuelensis TaxID=1999 RepID=A0A841D5Z7_PLAVE|nr:hypothetical protein [Planomonospora venezuelensis]MBB5964899.1 hypothetical protein [Planomonospora venezuelensis]GIM99487.1 hypothetical protein Pve01_11460 [Planomonospora venezuelensis]